jgi:serine/threonine protein phosphatase PrpC
MIVASDGVWEFISNEEAVKIVSPFWHNNDPEGACERLVKESVIHWKKVTRSN